MCSHLLCQPLCQPLCVQGDQTRCTLPSGASGLVGACGPIPWAGGGSWGDEELGLGLVPVRALGSHREWVSQGLRKGVQTEHRGQ